MLKFLVGLSLATLISGNVVNPQNNVNPQQPINCENSEVLLKVWTILSNLLSPDGNSVKVPDVTQIKYALTLIKKSLEKHPALHHESSTKLQHLVNELAQKKDVILNDTKPLRSLLEAGPVKNDLSSNMLFRYDLPSNIRPSCKAAFLNLIQVAQDAYVNMAKCPVCADANAEPLVPNTNVLTYYVPNRNPYNSALLSPSEEAMKKVTEYLKAPENFNSNVISLLESLQQKKPYVRPFHYDLNRNPQSEINSNILNADQNNAPYNVPDMNRNENLNAANYNSPLQGDLNINLEHAKDIANKLIAQNQYKPKIQDANSLPTVKEDASYLTGGGILNFPTKKQMTPAELQKLLYKPLENENNENIKNYMNPQQSQNNLYQPSVYYNPDPYQNQANLEIKNEFEDTEQPNNVGDNFNNNNFYGRGFNKPGNTNQIIYQNKFPNAQIPIGLQWPYNLNNNPALIDQANDVNGIANPAKLETNIRPKGQVELTYLLKRKRPLIYQPFYFVKYRLPYNYFVQNLKQMLSLEPDLNTPPTELYKGLIAPSNATEVSPDLASYPKEEIHNLVLKDGALVKAKYIKPNETEANDRTKDTDLDSSEAGFAGSDVVVQKVGSSQDNNGFYFNQNENIRPVVNSIELNLQNPVADQAMSNQETLYHKHIPLQQGNQGLQNYLASLGLEKLIAKEPNLAVTGYKVENLPYRQETSSNVGNQYSQYLGNQQSALNQIYSPYKEIHSAAPSVYNLPYLTKNQALLTNPYGTQATFGQNYRPHIQVYPFHQENPPVKVRYQFPRPSLAVRVASQSALGQVGSVQAPFIRRPEAALRFNNKFPGNNLISNNFHAFGQPRRLLGGFLNPNQYGYYIPGLSSNPNGLGSPYPGMLGNQGMLGQPGYANNFGNGLGQTYLYKQPPLYG